MAETVTKLCKPGATVLDIGSHFLHSSLLLSLLGYKVVSMDVAAFWDLPYIQERANQFKLQPVVENNLEVLASLKDHQGSFDLILFTEIFEHITFNPVNFWKRVQSLTKENGFIYITTPNSLTLSAIFKTLYNLLTFKGIGIDIPDVLNTVTYGHHWKEYSSREIKAYFFQLNEGFKVSINKFAYKPSANKPSLKNKIRGLLTTIGNSIPVFKEGLEVVVKVDKSSPWKIEPPKY